MRVVSTGESAVFISHRIKLFRSACFCVLCTASPVSFSHHAGEIVHVGIGVFPQCCVVILDTVYHLTKKQHKNSHMHKTKTVSTQEKKKDFLHVLRCCACSCCVYRVVL